MMFRGTLLCPSMKSTARRKLDRPLVVAAFAVVSVAGCTSSTAPSMHATAEVRTSAEVIPVEQTQFGRRVRIPFTVTNTGTRTLYYFGCNEAVDKLVNGSWVTAWGPICFVTIGSPPTPLAPAASATFTIEGVDYPNTAPRFDLVNIAPKYRLRVGFFFEGAAWPNRTVRRQVTATDEFTVTN